MKKAVWFLTPLLAVLLVVPLGAAVVLAAVITPAAAEQTRLDACGTTVAASGSWRAPPGGSTAVRVPWTCRANTTGAPTSVPSMASRPPLPDAGIG